MAQLTIIWWRDIPAQVTARAGRITAKRELPQRFQAAIDRAAMRGNARDTDTYLAQWRRSAPVPCGVDLDAAVAAEAERLERDYDDARLAALVANGGHAPA
jgi:hypothetical protein